MWEKFQSNFAIIDSQSVKTVYASEKIGFDAGKSCRYSWWFTCRKYPKISVFSEGSGYRGSFISNESVLGATGFHVIQNRWKVERTFAWYGISRQLAKDFEITTSSAISRLHILLKRL